MTETLEKPKTEYIKGNTINTSTEIALEVVKELTKSDELREWPEDYESPVYNTKRISLDLVKPNEYNPNTIAGAEMKALYTSIADFGYTMGIWIAPIDDTVEKFLKLIPDEKFMTAELTIEFLQNLDKSNLDSETQDAIAEYLEREDKNLFRVIDGFHRRLVVQVFPDINKREKNTVPCTVLYGLDYAMKLQGTILANRARGAHSTDFMSGIVAELVGLGKSTHWIARKLGMDIEEITRLKQITGIAALFSDKEFAQAWSVEDAGAFESREA